MSSPRPEVGPSWLGRRLELRVGPIAHGGHCVARYQGRVVFVRHALPDELVVAEVTEDRAGSFCRADAVEVLTASPQRVPPPCEYARPGGCGGCDFQHVALPEQRRLKAAVVAEQFRRLAGLDVEVEVLPVAPAGADSGLGWRRRIRFAIGPDALPGLRAHRSHRVIPVQRCLIGAPGVGDSALLNTPATGFAELELATDDRGEVAAIGYRERPPRRGQRSRKPRADRHSHGPAELRAGPAQLHYTVAGRDFTVGASGFWQTHPGVAEALSTAVLAGAGLRAGDQALDLYAGAGLFTAALGVAVTGTGAVLGLEGDAAAVSAAGHNLTDLDWTRVDRQPVTAESVRAAAGALGELAVVVLDPPRTGAGAEVIRAILAVAPRRVVYVACDPAALARDVRYALDGGWQLAGLTAFDAFPMTHHVECVAVLQPAPTHPGTA